jgi:hypothetical protein
LVFNLFWTSFFPKDNIISYIPGPNFEPVNTILRGWPTPLKFVLLDFIRPLITGSKISLLG